MTFSKSVDESESKLESVTSLSKASSSSRGGGGAGTEGAFRVVASPGNISYRDSYTFSVSELLQEPPGTNQINVYLLPKNIVKIKQNCLNAVIPPA